MKVAVAGFIDGAVGIIRICKFAFPFASRCNCLCDCDKIWFDLMITNSSVFWFSVPITYVSKLPNLVSAHTLQLL